MWAARFFKTRTLAKEAVSGGKVHVGGQRIKAAKTVSPGDTLCIRQGWDEKEIIIQALSNQRRPAVEAQLLYWETKASLLKRTSAAEARKATGASPSPAKRPDKVERKALKQLREHLKT